MRSAERCSVESSLSYHHPHHCPIATDTYTRARNRRSHRRRIAPSAHFFLYINVGLIHYSYQQSVLLQQRSCQTAAIRLSGYVAQTPARCSQCVDSGVCTCPSVMQMLGSERSNTYTRTAGRQNYLAQPVPTRGSGARLMSSPPSGSLLATATHSCHRLAEMLTKTLESYNISDFSSYLLEPYNLEPQR